MQVRLWCLQIPLPKIPPLLLAAKAIPNTLDVPELQSLLKRILTALTKAGICVVSYSCDGTETERAVQRNLQKASSSNVIFKVEHPVHGLPPIELKIPRPYADAAPLVMVQDSKHALKTFRNNLFSGARLLTFGDHIANYAHVRNLAFHSDSPLYDRDVEKVDRQDDNAATRLFSATSLEYICTKHPNLLGLIVYLFVLGELVDAYQNRFIPHTERIKMAFRARFFLEVWKAFLHEAGYPLSRYYISREAAEITNILVDALLALILVYRDHLDDVYPLLPWLHSTEVCEHAFGECRKLVKDFTFTDFLYMIPKVMVMLGATSRLYSTAESSDPKARRGGYAHTYYDTKGIDIATLSQFPTDTEIRIAVRQAWEETEGLMGLLGITAQDLIRTDSLAAVRIPSAASWFARGSDPILDLSGGFHWNAGFSVRVPSNFADSVSGLSDIDSESGSEHSDDIDDSSTEQSTAAAIEKLMLLDESSPLRSTKTDNKMLNLCCAAVVLSAEETDRLYAVCCLFMTKLAHGSCTIGALLMDLRRKKRVLSRRKTLTRSLSV